MSEKLKELREQAQELIVSGNATEKAQGHGMLAVLDTLEEEEDFKLRATFKIVNGELNTSVQIGTATLTEVLGMLELAKNNVLKKHG